MKKSAIKVISIRAKDTYRLRHPLLRAGRPIETCRFEHDDHPEAIHLGAFQNEEFIGILSALPNLCPNYPTRKCIQFRGIAVRPDFQRKGIASILIQHAIAELDKTYQPQCIWLNARVAAEALYKQNHFNALGEPFYIESIGWHQRFVKLLSHE